MAVPPALPVLQVSGNGVDRTDCGHVVERCRIGQRSTLTSRPALTTSKTLGTAAVGSEWLDLLENVVHGLLTNDFA